MGDGQRIGIRLDPDDWLVRISSAARRRETGRVIKLRNSGNDYPQLCKAWP
jgi:hypothetical protein